VFAPPPPHTRPPRPLPLPFAPGLPRSPLLLYRHRPSHQPASQRSAAGGTSSTDVLNEPASFGISGRGNSKFLPRRAFWMVRQIEKSGACCGGLGGSPRDSGQPNGQNSYWMLSVGRRSLGVMRDARLFCRCWPPQLLLEIPSPLYPTSSSGGARRIRTIQFLLPRLLCSTRGQTNFFSFSHLHRLRHSRACGDGPGSMARGVR